MELYHFGKRVGPVIELIGIAGQSLATPIQFAWRRLRRSRANLRRNEDPLLEGTLAMRGGDLSARRDQDRAVENWMNEGGSGAGSSP